MFAVYVSPWGYVIKHGGMVDFTQNIDAATHYRTRDDAEAGKVGHHRDMGGSGFKGTIERVPDYRRSR